MSILDQNLLTLDFRQDTVTYAGYTLPTGSIGCAAMNIPRQTNRAAHSVICSTGDGGCSDQRKNPKKRSILPLAKDKLELTIEDVTYANSSYEKEMEQAALLDEARAKI